MSTMLGDDSTYVTFSIKLMSVVRDPRKLLKSVVDELVKVQSQSDEWAQAYKEVEEDDVWARSAEGQAYQQQLLLQESAAMARYLRLVQNRGILE